MTFRKIQALAMTIGAIGCSTISGKLYGAAPVITYTASGTFAVIPTSGADSLKLAGEPFTVTITASAATAPLKSGPNWAAFNKLNLTGIVHSGLLNNQPVNIASGESSIIQAINPGQYDQFTMEAPVKVVGISLTIKAAVIMPIGTISKPLLHPFTAVSLAPGNATLNYSDGTNTTVLSIQSGSLTATIPGPASKAIFPMRSMDAGAGQAEASQDQGVLRFHTFGEEVAELNADGSGYFLPGRGTRGDEAARA